MERTIQGIIIGMAIMFFTVVWASKSPLTSIYRSQYSSCGVIQQKGSSDAYFTVTTNSYQEYLQQELGK